MIAKFQKNKKRSWQQLFFSVFLGTLLLLVVGFLFVSNWRINQRRTELNSQIETLKRKIEVLEEKRQNLEAQIYQTTEEDYLEKEARERFNLQKPGEEVVSVLPAEGKPLTAEKGFWQKLWDKIKIW